MRLGQTKAEFITMRIFIFFIAIIVNSCGVPPTSISQSTPENASASSLKQAAPKNIKRCASANASTGSKDQIPYIIDFQRDDSTCTFGVCEGPSNHVSIHRDGATTNAYGVLFTTDVDGTMQVSALTKVGGDKDDEQTGERVWIQVTMGNTQNNLTFTYSPSFGIVGVSGGLAIDGIGVPIWLTQSSPLICCEDPSDASCRDPRFP